MPQPTLVPPAEANSASTSSAERSLRLLAAKDFRPNHHIDLVMDGQKGRAVAYLVPDEE